MTLFLLKKFEIAIFKHWPVIPIIIISFLLPAIWLREGFVVDYGESGLLFSIDPSRQFNIMRYVWLEIAGSGVYGAGGNFASLSYHAITAGLQLLGCGTVLRQYLVFSMILLLSSISMYCLTLEVFLKETKASKFVPLISALFYILNPISMNYIWHRYTTFIFGLPIVPLSLFLIIKFSRNYSFKYAFLFSILLGICSFSASNPAFFVPLLLPATAYVIFKIILTKKLTLLKHYIWFFLLVIGFNSWWIIPFALGCKELTKHGFVQSFSGHLSLYSSFTPLLFILRMIDKELIHWYQVNYHPGWIEFLIPLFIGIVMLSVKLNRKFLSFLILLLFGLFFVKMANPPFGFLLEWLYNNIVYFRAFRTPLEKLGLVNAVCFSILVSIGIFKIWEMIKYKVLRVTIAGVILFLLLGVSVWPMWTGDVFSYRRLFISPSVFVPSPKVSIPEYWHESANFINSSDGNARILFLPQSDIDGMSYMWKHGYGGGEFCSTNLLFNMPVISHIINFWPAEEYRRMLTNNMILGEKIILPQLLSMMNIRYILVRNDVNETVRLYTPLKVLNRILAQCNSIEKENTFGSIDLYKIKDKYCMPHIYSIPQQP